NLERVWVDFDAYENQLGLFKTGQEIIITTNAYPGTKFRAQITFIDPVLDTRTRTVTVRAGLANSKGLLKPGMFVTGRMTVEGSGGNAALTVPASAVMWTGDRSLVYVKTRADEPVFEMREVTLGSRMGDSFVIENGLEAGTEIVTQGTFTVDAAAQLQGKRSMMNPRTSTSQNTMKHQYPEKLSKAFQIRLLEAIPSYLMMKDAFVESKPGAVSTNAREFREALETSGRSGPDDDGGAYLSEILERLEAIELSGDLEEQRRHFVILNEHLIALAQKLDLSDSPLYVQHCPMANQNKGALWLSDNKEIRNPYYGDAMLTCGSVMDSIQ
ncbi:MAG: efflux RND transporter periplasmic adaptor subunit, partial [Flavobacteriaceae bacterium]